MSTHRCCLRSPLRRGGRRCVGADRRRRRPSRQRRSSPSEVGAARSPAIPGRRRARGARLHRAGADADRGDRGKLLGAGAVGRPGVRARVRPDSARHLRVDSGRALGRRCAVRSLARARRRRRGVRHGAADRRQHVASRCGSSTCARAQQVLGREYTGAGHQPAALRAHDVRRDPPVAERSCAAWRAPSSRSRPIASASAPPTPSRSAT